MFIFAIIFAAVSQAGPPAVADDYERGLSAYNRAKYAEAFRAWQDLAAIGDRKAQFGTGLMYALGQGVEQDYGAAGLMAVSDTTLAPEAGVSMDSFRWHNRPLVVFAPAPRNPLVAAQREVLDRQGYAFRERDMILVEVIGDRVSINGRVTRGLDADAMRARYRVEAGEACALLVGKDGGVKLRSESAFSADELFGTIDAMPMRQREVRNP